MILLLLACTGETPADDTSIPDTDSHDSADTDPDTDTGETGQTPDADADGYTAEEGDCDDADATVHPGAADASGDGIDSNCDGVDSQRAVALSDVPSMEWRGQPGGGAGRTVSLVPDATGDGVPDCLIGAPLEQYDAEQQLNWSAAFVVSGAAPVSGLLSDVAFASWTLEGDAYARQEEGLGLAVTAAGDLDGDGVADLLVGDELVESQAGVAFAYAGGAPGAQLAAEGAMFQI